MSPENKEQLVELIREMNEMEANDPLLDSKQQEIVQLLGFVDQEILVKILISGLQPGTGSTTTKDLLNKVLGYKHFDDAGFYRRAIAQNWAAYYSYRHFLNESVSKQDVWNDFEFQFSDFPDGAIESINASVQPELFRDEVLNAFNADQAQFSQRNEFWEKLPDAIVWSQMEENESGVWQGKMTAIIDVILKKEMTELAGPVIRVLLEVDEYEAAKRIAFRENGNQEPSQEQIDIQLKKIQYRKTRDLELWKKIYGFDPSLFDRDDVLKIDTTHIPPEEVVAQILLHYIAVRAQHHVRE